MVNAILIGIAVGILMLVLLDPLLKWLWGIMGIKIPEINGMDYLRQSSPMFILVYVGVLYPILEEIMFRFLPLYLVMLCGNDYLTWSVAIFISVIFGFLHGSWKHILSIGVVGITFSWLFVNFGFVSCSAAHITNNFLYSCYFLSKKTTRSGPRLS